MKFFHCFKRSKWGPDNGPLQWWHFVLVSYGSSSSNSFKQDSGSLCSLHINTLKYLFTGSFVSQALFRCHRGRSSQHTHSFDFLISPFKHAIQVRNNSLFWRFLDFHYFFLYRLESIFIHKHHCLFACYLMRY